MPPPLFLLCIPTFALFFLIQMLLCEAYNFHITLSRHKEYIVPSAASKRAQGKKKRKEEVSKNQLYQGHTCKHFTMKSDQGCPPRNEGVPVKSHSARQRQPPQDVGYGMPKPQKLAMDDTHEEKEEVPSPTEDRLKTRRKSVFAESYDPSKDDEDIKIVHPKSPEEKLWLIENLGKITLFQHLARDQITTVVDAMYKYPVSEGDFIMKQGDKGSTFYVVQSGVYNVYVKDTGGVEKLVHTYNNVGSFGELALLYNQPRAATIVAQSEGALWAVDGQTFRRIVHKITYQKRQMYESLINNVPILKPLEAYERANLVDALVAMTFQHNQAIVKQGEHGDGMYFIISGGVRIVMKTSHNKEILIKELGNSEYFGELALVTNKPRVASAFSVGMTHVAFLDREAFERLLGPCMDVIRRNIDDYNTRLSEILQGEE